MAEETGTTPTEGNSGATPSGEGLGFLDGQTTATPTEQKGGDQQQTAKPGEQPALIGGKYKTQDDLLKAHKELESKLGKVNQTPEAYELNDSMKELGLSWKNDDHKAEVSTALKAANLRQDQWEALAPIYVEQVRAEIGRVMHVVDSPAEQASLKKEWGGDYDSRMKEIGEFAKSLPREVVFAPLHHSAAGMKLLHQMMSEKRGPTLISNNDSGPTSQGSLNARLEQIIADPNYQANNKQGEQLRAEAYNVSKRISGQR